MRLTSLAQPGEDAAFGIMHDEPFEPGIFAIEFMQRRHCPVEAVEITHQRPGAGGTWGGEEGAIGAKGIAPLVFLGGLACPAQELLAGMTEHEAIIGAQIGEALPLVTRHAAEK